MEKQKLIYVESKALFSPSEVSDKAIVFIKDTKEIWTHGVYFSCSGTWATPITLSLTGDTTGSVSIDGSGNASIATTTKYLSGMVSSADDCNGTATTLPGNVTYYPCVLNGAANGFPTVNNANGILSLNVHDYSYTHLLGFSSNGNIYHRRRSGGTWETTWKTILNSNNYTNFHHTFASLTNKPTTLSGYGITDCIPIISGRVTPDTDLSTLGMTTTGAKLSVSHTGDSGSPSWLYLYSNFLMFRSTVDTYGGIATATFHEYVTFIGGRNPETTSNNVPNWWFRIKGNSETTYDLNSILNKINNLDSNYLRKSGGTMTGILTLTTGSAYINDTASGYSIYGSMEASNTSIGTSGLATIFSGAPTLNMVLRTSGDNLYHYNHSKSARYLILDTNNYSSYALPLSGGTMTGALNFANNTWNKVGDDAYMGDCNVAGMIGIKGSNAATPGFAMYNNSGNLLGKLYASGSDLYWSGVKLLTSTGSAQEAYLAWGGRNLRNNSSPIDTILAPILGANRLAFLSPNAIDIEYSKDSGTTWTDYNISDSNKVLLFAGGNNYARLYLGGDSTQDASIDRTSWRLRITISAIGYSLYCRFLKFMIFVTDYGNALKCALLGRTYSNVQNDVDTWVTFLDASLGGWSGWNTINHPAGITIPHVNYYGQIRFEFYMTSLGTTGTASCIQKIMGFASACWTWPSNMAGYGNIYSYDWQLNVTFPAKVTATGGFSGNLTGDVTGNLIGNASTASKWKDARTITLTGDVTGSVSLDGSSNVTLTTATSGTGTTSFLKCLDKRNSYPALIVTSGGNIGAAFIHKSMLGGAEGTWYDAIVLRGYVDDSAGNENALLFSKNSSSVYHSQYAFGSTTTWGTMYKFLDSNNYSSYALPLSGGTMTGAITLTSGSGAAYDKNALSFIKSSNKSEQARIGTDTDNGLGMYATGKIYIRPNVTLGSGSTNGLIISNSSFTYNGTAVSLAGHTHPWSDITSKPSLLGEMAKPIFLLYSFFDLKLGAYISTINNRFYSADLRYTVTTTNFASGSVHYLFDDNYDNRMQINMGTTATITIEGYNFVYNNGYIILSFYMYSAYPLLLPKTATVVATTQSGTTYTLNRATSVEAYGTMAFSIGLEYLTKLEITIVSLDNAYCGITNIDYYSRRTENTARDCAVVTKYNANTLYHNLTAPKYIVKNGTSSQFLKADGSLDSSNYYKIGTELPIYRSVHVRDKNTNAGIFGVVNSGSDLIGGTDLETVYAGTSNLPFILRTSSDNLYHYNNAKTTRYKILDSFNVSSYALPLSGGTLGSSTASFIDLFIKSSTAKLRLTSFTDSTTYIQSGNSDFTGNATLKITGYNGNTGSKLYFSFANIYCRAGNYTNIDSGNYSNYALKVDGTNGTADGVSTLLNKLTTGTATPVDADYYICQYAGGGTTTTSYHRRPVSALYTYIKSKLSLNPDERFIYATSATSNQYGTTEATGSSSTLTRTLFWRDNDRNRIGIYVQHSDNLNYGFELASSYGEDSLIYRRKFNGTWETLQTVLTSSNYNNYSPTLTGTGASGTWAINISGVAASASKVANALTIQLNGGTTAGTNKFVYDGSSAYTINITPEAIGASATSHTHSYLPLSGGTLGSSTVNGAELNVLSSTARLQLIAYSDATNYIESGNSAFNGNATLKITGYSATTGSNLYFNFANIYCRAGNYTNIDSGNYSSYALPLSGGTLTDTLISRDIRPSANLSYSLGTSSYYYNYVYANYFKKNGSSDSYVLLGGGGHKAVSDFAPNNVANLSSSGMGNSDLWTLVFEKSYPANYWYNPTTMFYVRSGTIGCGILCFYNYWASGTQLNDYEKEAWFFGAGKSETSTAFGGANRDINDYFRIYIDKANFKYCMYYNRYNDLSLKILELLFFTVPEPGEYISTGSLRTSFFTNSTTVVDLPTESSTLVRVPIKTTYNHDRTIKTTKSVYASSFYENSDIRLKENVRGIDLSDLTKLVDLVQFNFKDGGTKKYGVIAQLLELVGLQNLVYENNGNKAVDYISLLVLEIQRLRNEIGELKLEINKKS